MGNTISNKVYGYSVPDVVASFDASLRIRGFTGEIKKCERGFFIKDGNRNRHLIITSLDVNGKQVFICKLEK